MSTKEAKTTKKLERHYTCSVCNNQYVAVRYAAKKFCSSKCRKSASNLKVATKRIARLPDSDEWRFVASECRRAGTVEILHSHTVESLEALFALRNFKFKAYGYNSEKKTSKFDLCHIQPVNGADSVGLLHPLNLFVGGSLPNKKQGTKSYKGVGLSIKRSALKSKWLVDKRDDNTTILAKVEKYLGKVLLEYAKRNTVRTSQRIGLARWIVNNDPEQRFKFSDLEHKSMSDLRKLRAEIEEREVYKIELTPKRSLLVYLQECQRFSEVLPASRQKEDCTFLIDVLQVAITTLAMSYGEDGFHSMIEKPAAYTWAPAEIRDYTEERFSKFRNWLAFLSFETLQGKPLNRVEVKSILCSYIRIVDLTPTLNSYINKQVNITSLQGDEFSQAVVKFQNLALSLGLMDGIQEMFFLVSCKEAHSETAATVEWLDNFDSCHNQYDYSTVFYEVEDDYITAPLGDEAFMYLGHTPLETEAIPRFSHAF